MASKSTSKDAPAADVDPITEAVSQLETPEPPDPSASTAREQHVEAEPADEPAASEQEDTADAT